jgi:hypothetical protein
MPIQLVPKEQRKCLRGGKADEKKTKAVKGLLVIGQGKAISNRTRVLPASLHYIESCYVHHFSASCLLNLMYRHWMALVNRINYWKKIS